MRVRHNRVHACFRSIAPLRKEVGGRPYLTSLWERGEGKATVKSGIAIDSYGQISALGRPQSVQAQRLFQNPHITAVK